ncbi:MAG: hypothetical protein AMXMBFR56_12100 [Polyangiaceae bacterium]
MTGAASIDAARAEIDRLTDGHGVDVLVNNAGFGIAAPLIEASDTDVRAQYETNVFGLLAVTRAFVPAMLSRRSGRIINVSSVGGRVTLPFMGAYNSTKYAVESLSDALRRELLPFGIRISVIEPGLIRSEFADKSMAFVATRTEPSASPFAEVYANAGAIRAASEQGAVGPECIALAVERAITARRARATWPHGPHARSCSWPAQCPRPGWTRSSPGASRGSVAESGRPRGRGRRARSRGEERLAHRAPDRL